MAFSCFLDLGSLDLAFDVSDSNMRQVPKGAAPGFCLNLLWPEESPCSSQPSCQSPGKAEALSFQTASPELFPLRGFLVTLPGQLAAAMGKLHSALRVPCTSRGHGQ